MVPAGPPPAQSLPVMTMAELTVEWRGKPCSAPATAFQRWLGLSYLPGLAWAGLVSSSDHSTPPGGKLSHYETNVSLHCHLQHFQQDQTEESGQGS